jgi:hypothetical protein
MKNHGYLKHASLLTTNINFKTGVKFTVLTLIVFSESNVSISANLGSTFRANSGTVLSLRLLKKATRRSSAWFRRNGLTSGSNAKLMRAGTSVQLPSHTFASTDLKRPG